VAGLPHWQQTGDDQQEGAAASPPGFGDSQGTHEHAENAEHGDEPDKNRGKVCHLEKGNRPRS